MPDEDLADRLPQGTRSVSVFLVNERIPDKDTPDRAYVFQAGLVVRCEVPFVPRPDLRSSFPDDWDEEVADFHYAGSLLSPASASGSSRRAPAAHARPSPLE
jgi:hypothetical protein